MITFNAKIQSMLELRPSCEHCHKPLPPESAEAMICTYECTFCVACVEALLENVCPNCGGGFEKRPVRPKNGLAKHPASKKQVYKPIHFDSFKELKEQYKNIKPADR